MKSLYSSLVKFFVQTLFYQEQGETKNIFDYSSRERIRLLRAAGREAQREQADLLRKYESQFGQF